MQEGVKALGDSAFINTTYSFNSAVVSTYDYALKFIVKDGGAVRSNRIRIKTQQPVEPKLEVAFPDVVFDKRVSIFDEKAWSFRGKWKAYEVAGSDNLKRKQSMFSENPCDELEIAFNGTGLALYGNWYKDGGKGEKRPEAEGARVYITGATIFKTAPKKSDDFKFSFEN
jgi:hypothetical protein